MRRYGGWWIADCKAVHEAKLTPTGQIDNACYHENGKQQTKPETDDAVPEQVLDFIKRMIRLRVSQVAGLHRVIWLVDRADRAQVAGH
jgi:hypothetical protein